jgi:hypothetical protein
MRISFRNTRSLDDVRLLFHRGFRSIGMIGGDVPTWMVPRTSNPCR